MVITGGPAFPFPDPQGPAPGALLGMSLRDYFAAHAPEKPQPWFEPAMPPEPPLVPGFTDVEPILQDLAPPDDERQRVRNVLFGIAAGPDDEGWDFDAGIHFLRSEADLVVSAEQEAAIRALVPAMAAWRIKRDAVLSLRLDWSKERDRQRFLQWPYAWADEQLKARDLAHHLAG